MIRREQRHRERVSLLNSFTIVASLTLLHCHLFQILKLSQTAVSKINTGHVINLASADLTFFHYSTISLHNIWQGPVEMFLSVFLMWYYIGISSLIGVVMVLLLLPYQLFVGYYGGYALHQKVAAEIKQRVSLIGEMVTGIRVIKMNTWEWSIKKIIHQIRA